MSGALHVSPAFEPEGARASASPSATVVSFGPYTLDMASGDLRKFGYRMKLQPKSFLVLQALLESPGQMVSREDLRARLWAENTFVEFESSLNVAVRRLREALNDEAQNPTYIETIPRKGYRFLGVPSYAEPISVAPGIHAVESADTVVTTVPELPASSQPANRWKFLTAIVAMLLAVALSGWWWNTRTLKHSAPVSSSIAVLPFADLSPEKNQRYFSDGLAEELLNDLAKTPGLRVAARTSSFQFRDSGDLKAIGKSLGVATLLEGSVRKSGNRVRISAELVKAEDGFQLWSGTYDRNLNDVFALQDEIARAISGELKVRLLSHTGNAPRGTNAEAYNAYLQGRYFYERRTPDDLVRAQDYFRQAVQLDSHYARAWSALAWALIARAEGGDGPPFEQGYREAMQAAQRALQLDTGLAEAHAAIGRIKRSYDWDWTGARAAFQKALALEPQNSVVLLGASSLEASLGNFDEAIALNRRAVEIDPLSVVAHLSLGIHAYYAGQQALAIDAYQKALAISPNAPEAHYLLGLVYLAQSHPQQALVEFEKNPAGSQRVVGEALAYAALGRTVEADAALRQLIAEHRNGAAYQIAEVYAYRGDQAKAMDWLEAAREQKDAGLPGISGDPLLKNLAHNPKFTAFLQSVGLH